MQIDYFDVFADQPLHDVQIVNHQIEHDIDVERTRGEFPDAMDFEVDGIAHVWTQGYERGIEAFEMADLEQRASLLRGSNHSIGFSQRWRDRLFDQHVNPRFQQSAGDLAMRFRRNRETDGIDAANQIAPIGGPLNFALHRDCTSGVLGNVTD